MPCAVPVWLIRSYRRRRKKGPPCHGAGSDPVGEKGELLYGIDRNQLAIGPSFEGHDAVGGGEESVVTAPSDIPARMELRAPLPDDDSSGPDLLAAVALHAETL